MAPGNCGLQEAAQLALAHAEATGNPRELAGAWQVMAQLSPPAEAGYRPDPAAPLRSLRATVMLRV
ncbi:MAG: hypothetical protein H6646_00400 [Anaerolineales bacterium]|nr:hypothetical protein [Anaerolineales bacterium]